MEKNTEQLALVNTLEGVVVTKELVASADFSQKYEYLLGLISYLDSIKKAVDSGVKEIVKDNYFETGESSVVSEGFRFTYVPATTREGVDTKKLKTENPELYKQYVKISNVNESFRVTALKKSSYTEVIEG